MWQRLRLHHLLCCTQKTPCCTQTSWLYVWQNWSYCRSKFNIVGIRIFDLFGSCDPGPPKGILQKCKHNKLRMNVKRQRQTIERWHWSINLQSGSVERLILLNHTMTDTHNSNMMFKKLQCPYYYLCQGGYVMPDICLLVLLSVSNSTQKLLIGSSWKFYHG